MSEQHAQVLVAALADAPEVAGAARGGLLRCQAEPGGEVTGIGEVQNCAAGGRSDRRGGQEPHTGNAHQSTLQNAPVRIGAG